MRGNMLPHPTSLDSRRIRTALLVVTISWIGLFLPAQAKARDVWQCVDATGHRYESSQNVPSDTCAELMIAAPSSQAEISPAPLTRDNNAVPQTIVALVVLAFAVLLYFLPTAAAVRRGSPDAKAIFIINLLLGWLLIPWVIALAWAYKANTVAAAVDGSASARLCPYCAESVKTGAIKCKHCQSDLLPVATTPK